MLGSLFSMKLIGKKTWMQSIAFWVVILVIGFLLGIVFSSVHIAYLLTVIGCITYVMIAHYWYKLRWIQSIASWGFALIIDWAILYIVLYFFDFSFTWIMGG